MKAEAISSTRSSTPWKNRTYFDLDGVPVIERLKKKWEIILREYRAAESADQENRTQYPLDIAIGSWLITSLRSNDVEYGYLTREARMRTVQSVIGEAANSLSPQELDAFFRGFCETKMAESRKRHPTVVSILDPIYPEGCSNYNFSLLKPGVVISPHQGVDAGNIRTHLCLIEAGECWLNVAGEMRGWTCGEVFGFDDHHMHWAVNSGERERLVLIVDFSKAYLERELRAVAASQGPGVESSPRRPL